MPVRLVINMRARQGKGGELLQAMTERCRQVQQEPGCLQFEVFQSGLDPDKVVLLELWQDQAALDTHAQLMGSQPANPRIADLREGGPGEREDYEYNRTR